MKTTTQMVRATLTVLGLIGCLALTACSTTPTSEADRAIGQRAERIADRMGNRQSN